MESGKVPRVSSKTGSSSRSMPSDQWGSKERPMAKGFRTRFSGPSEINAAKRKSGRRRTSPKQVVCVGFVRRGRDHAPRCNR